LDKRSEFKKKKFRHGEIDGGGDNCRLVCYLPGLPSIPLKGLLIKLHSIPILNVAFSPSCFQAIVEP
jgi:hypothetical protein